MFKLEITTRGAAFDQGAPELILAVLLQEVAAAVRGRGVGGSAQVIDPNGNAVGRWEWRDD